MKSIEKLPVLNANTEKWQVRWRKLRGTFIKKLASINPPEGGRRWQYVAYDQLNDALGLMGCVEPQSLGIILVESTWKPHLRPYHKHKLALLLSSQRHFALEQAARGVHVRYIFSKAPPCEVMAAECDARGSIAMVRPAERELRAHLQPLFESKQLLEMPHTGWLTTTDDFRQAMKGKKTWKMDSFYRYVRKKYDVLLTADGKPEGGKWSHDADNRRPWNGDPEAPTPPTFDVDDITEEVIALIETQYASHPGRITAERIPARLADVQSYWEWVQQFCMYHFGPYEDAMHHEQRQLFHTRISAVVNLGRILPIQILKDVEAKQLPLNSKEGFIRQLLGWREYVRHIHELTDGFRNLPAHANEQLQVQAGPTVNLLASDGPLPPAYWGQTSGLFCLDHAVKEVVEDAHSHHINRLMVLSNWGSLLDVSPRALTDWFWVMFEDAYDWVVEPNVLGMGTYALGDLMMTKPYVSGSAYVHKMSTYCGQCEFNPKRNCPMTNLYWRYLKKHGDHFSRNQRMSLIMASLRRRGAEKHREDDLVFHTLQGALGRGETLSPSHWSRLLEEARCDARSSCG